MTDPEKLTEARRLLAEGDAHLLKGELMAAAQTYHAAAELLEGQGEKGASILASGLHFLSTGMSDYFDDEISSSLNAIRSAMKAFKKGQHRDYFQFAKALRYIFKVDYWCDRDQYRVARLFLGQAWSLLREIKTRNAQFAAPCSYWIHWSHIKYLFELVGDLVSREEVEIAARKAESMKGVEDELVALSGGSAAAKALYGILTSISAAAVALGRGELASEEMELNRALDHFKLTRNIIGDARKMSSGIELPRSVWNMAGDATYLENLTTAAERRARARYWVFHGDRLSAVREMRTSVNELTRLRNEAATADSELAGWRTDIEDDFEEAERYLRVISKGDPEVLALVPAIKSKVRPELAEVIEGDLSELTNCTMQGSWRSVVVLAGGVLEAFLCGALEPYRPQGKIRDPKRELEEWELGPLIALAEETGVVRSGDALVTRTLKDFRNLIHPGKRLREKLLDLEHEGRAAIEVLKVIVKRLGTQRTS